MNDTRPIGLFDSGVGGTTIWRAIHELLPNENAIFLADSNNAPYGQKSKEEILQLSIKNIDWLLKNNAKIIVIACNTATTNAISDLRNSYDIPIIGVEPAIKPAAIHSKNGRVGVLATQSTILSKKYKEAQLQYPDVVFYNQIGYDLVRLIEEGKLFSPEVKNLLIQYITPMLEGDIDKLVLGCTHYPYLAPILKTFLPNNIELIDSGKAVALQTQKILKDKNLLKTDAIEGIVNFFTNKDPFVLDSLVGDFGSVKKIVF